MDKQINRASRLWHGFLPIEWGLLLFLLVVRVSGMIWIPLNDTTEARYGEMARKMLVSGDWITLWHANGVPFWGKPPLAIWMSALSMKLFGVTAFAARLPSAVCSMAVLMMIYHVVKVYRGLVVARLSVLTLASSLLFYITSSTVMMDPGLMFAIVLSELSFWHAMQTGSKRAGYLFFLGLSIGLLVKGPVVLVIVGGSVVLWVMIKNQWRAFWSVLPWVYGSILLLALVLPWYVMAELKTPGFLNYFIVGEHFSRFFQSAWQGDKYGFAHSQPLGIIWVYLWMGALPWSLLMTLKICSARSLRQIIFKEQRSDWLVYWGLCFLFPLIFFTFSKNLIYPYALPVMPAFAILFADGWIRFQVDAVKHHMIYVLILLLGIGFTACIVLFCWKPAYIGRSQDRIIALWKKQAEHAENPLLYWRNTLEFSAQFYSNGRALACMQPKAICHLIHPNKPVYWVVNKQSLAQFAVAMNTPFSVVGEVRSEKKVAVLLRMHMPCKK